MPTKIQDAETKRPSEEAKPQPAAAPTTFRAVLTRAKAFPRPANPTDILCFSEGLRTLPDWARSTNSFKHGLADGSIALVEG